MCSFRYTVVPECLERLRSYPEWNDLRVARRLGLVDVHGRSNDRWVRHAGMSRSIGVKLLS